MNETRACTSCGKETRAERMQVRRVPVLYGYGKVTIRYCPKCAQHRDAALQAIRERRERCG